MHPFGLAGEGGLEEGVEGADDLEVLGAAGFGFGAAVDPVGPALHDNDVEGRAFVAAVDGDALELAGAGEDFFDAAEAVGVAVDEGVFAAFDAEFVGALAGIRRGDHGDAGAALKREFGGGGGLAAPGGGGRAEAVAGDFDDGLSHHGNDGVDFMHGHLPELGVLRVGVLPAAGFVGDHVADLGFAMHALGNEPPHGALAGHVAPLLVDDDFEPGGVGFVLQGFGGGQGEGVGLFDKNVFAGIEGLANQEFVGAGPGGDDDGVDVLLLEGFIEGA